MGTPAVRHRLLLVLTLVAALAISGRLLWIQGLDASARAQEAIQQRTTERAIPALRGDITDRHGTVLAGSVERYDLWVDQRQVPEYLERDKDAELTGVAAAAKELAPVMGWTEEQARKKLTGKRGFLYLGKNVEPKLREAALALKIPGIGSTRVADRIYPAGSVGGNIIGFVGADGKALGGAELTYDKHLKGTDGHTKYERGAGGQLIPTGEHSTVPARDGDSLVLTIDRDLQWKAQQITAQTVQRWGAASGAVVALNARTGEVLALAEYPTYDPNSVADADPASLGNRSVSSVFEPGSTGKLFTMAAAIEEGVATPADQFEVPDQRYWDGHRIKDSTHHPVKHYTLAGVLKHSSNVGTVEVAERMSPQTRHDYLRKFGLGQKTGVGLPGESAGIVHPADKWHGRTRYATAFGQGYSVTALQMVSAVSTFANEGVRVQPQIVKGVKEKDGTVRPLGEPKRTRVLSSATADTMLQMMDTAVEDGKHKASVPQYAVAGKTGTAQVPDGTYTASFIGFAPADNPEIVVGVFLFGLHGFISGGVAAAPAFSDMMGYTLQSQGLAPTGKAPRELKTEW